MGIFLRKIFEKIIFQILNLRILFKISFALIFAFSFSCKPFGKSFFPAEHLDKSLQNEGVLDPETKTVNPTAPPLNPNLTEHTNKSFPGNYVIAGSTLSLDYNNLFSNNDEGMTYTCFFDEQVDSSVSSSFSCSSLPGTFSFSSSTGILTWTSPSTLHQSFELKISGSNFNGVSTKILVVSWVPAINYQNIAGYWDARFADRQSLVSSSYPNWLDLSSNAWHGAISNLSNSIWQGSNAATNPFHLRLLGGNSINFGDSVVENATKMMFSTWIQSENGSSTAESVIFGNNSGATGNGFSLKQKASYREFVLGLSPVGYWPLNEATGTIARDIGVNALHGTYVNGAVLNQAGALALDEGSSVNFDGGNDAVILAGSSALKFGSGNFTYNAWIRTSTGGYDFIVADNINTNPQRYLSINISVAVAACRDSALNEAAAIGTTVINDGQWHMLTGVRQGNTVYIYVDGRLNGSGTNASLGSCDSPASVYIANSAGTGAEYQGNVDEVAIFNTALSASTIYQMYTIGRRGKQLDFVVGADYRTLVDASAPLSRFSFDESSGVIAHDAGSILNHGTYVSGASINQTGGIVGNTNRNVRLDGTNDTISIPHHSSYNVGTGDFSVEFWMKANTPYGINNSYALVGKTTNFQTTSGWMVELSTWSGSTTDGQIQFINTGQGTWCVACASTANIPMGTWYHVVALRSSGVLRLYVNGALNVSNSHADASLTINNTAAITIGDSAWGPYSPINIDEFQFYNYALNASDILSRYNAGAGISGNTCSSTITVLDGIWNHISGLFDGSNMYLHVNGRQACTVSSVPAKLADPSSAFIAGASSDSSKSFFGKIADILLYATTDGSSVATTSDMKNNFAIHADSFRKSPQKNLVTNGLVFHVDAANAKQGVSPRDNGCANYDLSWFDLGTSLLSTTFNNFTNCGVTTGWNGDGTTTISGSAGPYRLSFDGVDDYVVVPDSATTSPGTGTHSVAAWVNTTSSCTGNIYVFLEYGVPWQNNFSLSCLVGGFPSCFYRDGAGNSMTVTPSQTMNDGRWHYLTCVRNSQTSLIMYVDGVQVGTTTNASVGAIALDNGNPGAIGAWTQTAMASSQFWQGHIASFSIYNRGLTSSEVIQNCNAFKDRFVDASCP